MRGRLFVALTLLSCATPTASVEAPAPAATRSDTSDAELEQAWDRSAEAAPTPVEPPPVDVVDRRAPFAQAMAAAKAALNARQLDAARVAANTAVEEAEHLDGVARLQAHQLAFRLAQASASPTAAEAAARAWRFACGPERMESCRAAASAAWASVGRMKGADRKVVQRARAFDDAERCAVRADTSPQPCEAAALALADNQHDGLLRQRLLFARALRERDVRLLERGLEKADAACATPSCLGLRRKILGRLVALARERNDAEAAVEFALREVEAVGAPLPEADRRWTRTALLDQTCISFDTARGAGSCRTMEKQRLGHWTFHDYSLEPASQGLSGDQVRVVNEHFAPLLQECLSEEAHRMTSPDSARFDVKWVVFNTGRVGAAHLRPDLDATLLAKCLRTQFGHWRYPRYEGEYQHVEQSFTITATERRR